MPPIWRQRNLNSHAPFAFCHKNQLHLSCLSGEIKTEKNEMPNCDIDILKCQPLVGQTLRMGWVRFQPSGWVGQNGLWVGSNPQRFFRSVEALALKRFGVRRPRDISKFCETFVVIQITQIMHVKMEASRRRTSHPNRQSFTRIVKKSIQIHDL